MASLILFLARFTQNLVKKAENYHIWTGNCTLWTFVSIHTWVCFRGWKQLTLRCIITHYTWNQTSYCSPRFYPFSIKDTIISKYINDYLPNCIYFAIYMSNEYELWHKTQTGKEEAWCHPAGVPLKCILIKPNIFLKTTLHNVTECTPGGILIFKRRSYLISLPWGNTSDP